MTRGYPRTLPALLDRTLSRFADRPALATPDGQISYRELDARSSALAATLVDQGMTATDPIAVLAPNTAGHVVADIAVYRCGAARVPVNPLHSPDEIRHVLADATVQTVVVHASERETVDALRDDVPSLERVVEIDDAGRTPDATTHATSETPTEASSTPVTDRGSRSSEVTPDDLAGLFYTGGTTGEPKGVRYTQRCLVENLKAHLVEFGFDGRDVGLVATPLAHSGGTFALAGLLGGGTVVLADGFDPASFAATIEREGVTWTFLVPTMLYRLVDHDPFDAEPFDSLARVLYGAAPIRPDRLRDAIERFGPVFQQFYGQTEVPNLVTTFGREEHRRAYERDDRERLASAGTPCLQVAVEIRDAETDAVVDAGVPGEVVVAAPYAFDGYHERPEATAATLDDGWVRTGDVGVLDDDGYLRLLDRQSAVIVTGGMNVYAQEVEGALGEHPAVVDVAVVGVPHAEWGEAVHAVVVTDEAVTQDALGEHVAGRLASYKQPKSVAFADDLPTTAHGKVDRDAVRERYWDDDDRRIG